MQVVIKQLWDSFTDTLGTTIIHPQYFLKKYSDTAIKLALRHADGVLVDIGCGRMPYKKRFIAVGRVKKYIGIDHPETAKLYKGEVKPDIFADAVKIPLLNNSADSVLMLQVLEHLENPLSALKEIKRILKPGGKLYLSTVQWYILHDEPYDFFRYTKYGLKSLLKKAGLKFETGKEEGNVFVLIFQALNVYLMLLLKFFSRTFIGKIIAVLLLPLFLLICVSSNIKALILGYLDPKSKFAIIHTVTAKK